MVNRRAKLQVIDGDCCAFAGTDPYTYIIIDNDGTDAVTGTFSSVANSVAFLTPTVSYTGGDGNDVGLTLTPNNVGPTPTPLFPSAAATLNQAGAAAALDDLVQTSGSDSAAVYNEILVLNTANAQAAFDSTSGEAYASRQHLIADISDLFTRTTQRRSALLPTDGEHRAPAAWLAALGSQSTFKSNGNSAGMNGDPYGMSGGVDLISAPLNRDGGIVAGVAAGYIKAKADANARRSSLDTKTTLVGLYAALHSGPFQASLTASAGWTTGDMTRSIVVGALNRTARGHFKAHTTGISAQLRYDLPMNGLRASPLVTIDASHVSLKSFSETGAGALDLALAGEKFTSARLGGGAELGFGEGGSPVSGSVRLLYASDVGDRAVSQTAQFAGSPTPFEVYGSGQHRSGIAAGAALAWQLTSRAVLTASYDGGFASGSNTHRGAVGLTFGF